MMSKYITLYYKGSHNEMIMYFFSDARMVNCKTFDYNLLLLDHVIVFIIKHDFDSKYCIVLSEFSN